MNLFYAPDIAGDEFVLDREESRHIVRVLRKVQGDTIHFTDGKGNLFTCIIREANPNACVLTVSERRSGSDRRDFHLTLAVAPTKNISRYEWFLEKATEIGIDRIIPFFGEHSERTKLKPERLEKVLIAAMKQSLKTQLPELSNTLSFRELVTMNLEGQKFIAHAEGGAGLLLSKAYRPGQSATILIGPEGDFSEGEVNEAKKHGFLPVSLGPSRLRTETAAVAACHTINLLNMK